MWLQGHSQRRGGFAIPLHLNLWSSFVA